MIRIFLTLAAAQLSLAAPRQHAKLVRVSELGGHETLMVDCGEDSCQAVRTLGKSERRFAVDSAKAHAAIAAFLKESGDEATHDDGGTTLRWEVVGRNGRRKGGVPAEIRSEGDVRRVKAAVALERRLLSLLP